MKLTEITAPDFDLAMTLDSGQVFQWGKIGKRFYGTIGDRAVWVEQRDDVLRVGEGKSPALSSIIENYFALDHPLAEICDSFPDDPIMNTARSYCRGLRIIRQPKWECLATFITSSMKQVAHIRQISKKLRERFGDVRTIRLQCLQSGNGGSVAPRKMPIYSASPTIVNIELATGRVRPIGGQGTARSTKKHMLYTFPTAERLAGSSEKELRECALGYRAKNLLATAQLVESGAVNLEKWSALSDIDLRANLCQLPGVGAKVANCVMLFAYERLRAFPIDVWIERVLKEKYFPRARKLNAARLRAFTEKYFGEHGGYAQQYLFHHARMASRKRAIEVNRPYLARMSSKVGAVHRTVRNLSAPPR